MFYVYVLKSKKNSLLYVGYTNNLKRRFIEHNEGKNISTKYMTPFELVYYEAYKAQRDAKTREQSLKKHAGAYTQLKKRLNNSIA